MAEPMRLQRFLSQAGVAARRKAEELIVAGRVTVNGKVIRELGTKTKSFYNTLIFGCGNPGACSFDELDTQKADLKDPKHDHCGSVMIKGLTWDTGRSPDQQYPNELLVRATMKIYKFVPDRPHGEDCTKKQKEEHDVDNPKM